MSENKFIQQRSRMDFAQEEKRRKKAREFISNENVARSLKSAEIKVPANFAEMIPKGASPIRTKDIKELMRIANFWRPAIKPESFDDFVVNMVLRFMAIHVVAINNNPRCDKLYIGSKAELKEEIEKKGFVIADVLITTVLSSGGNASFVDTPTRFHFD